MTPVAQRAHDLQRLVDDLRRLGLPQGGQVLVHCSMRALGFVRGGPDTLLSAIQQVIGPTGTVVVPTQTANNSTTSRDHHAAIAGMRRRQRKRYVEGLPGFDRDRSPSFRMGLLAEHVRTRPDAVRSGHPQTSFAAIGPSAGTLMARHRLDSHLGDESPLAALHDANGYSLMVGVGYDKCTALHLAEYRLPKGVPTRTKQYRCFVARGRHRTTLLFRAIDLDDSCFPQLGESLDSRPFVRTGSVGDAYARLIPIKDAVDHAIGWIARWRTAH
ncbi:aminoglycoside N(3)-acetyltransferase [Asanoa siamensis]|uniref:Aminoglycoside N(3)-acetyltransferase n=1 Tax=Asanoa siamensis TaxID=926357 RepID=A0ABQ4CNQ6_9ACTN|nr:AAC(3) family N-acetyltransferase [Asanoa siamensis]GIF72920.1 AAC(3) family N-acetyltransferase [Asanoa siamensis]